MSRRPFPALLLALLLAAVAMACRSFPDSAAEHLVRTYNEKLIEAYRSSDEQVVEGLVGDEEAKKILGLIGVKKDMGLSLDSTLMEFKIIRIEHPAKSRVEVLSEERWRYADRRIGTGAVVGQESQDHYFMRYTLEQKGKAWVVEKVAFEKPPVVGREETPNRAAPDVFHGMAPAAAPKPSPSGQTPGRNP